MCFLLSALPRPARQLLNLTMENNSGPPPMTSLVDVTADKQHHSSNMDAAPVSRPIAYPPPERW